MNPNIPSNRAENTRMASIRQLPHSIRAAIAPVLLATACGGAAQQIPAAEPPRGPQVATEPTKEEKGPKPIACQTVECLQQHDSTSVASNTLIDEHFQVEDLRPDTAYYAIDMLPDNDPSLPKILKRFAEAWDADRYDERRLKEKGFACIRWESGNRCLDRDRKTILKRVLGKIKQPEMVFKALSDHPGDFFFKELAEKIPENHKVAIANLYRPERAERAAARITNPKLALELIEADGVHDKGKKVLALKAIEALEEEAANALFNDPEASYYLRVAALEKGLVTEASAKKATEHLFHFGPEVYVEMFKQKLISPKEGSEMFTDDRVANLEFRLEILEAGMVTPEVMRKVYADPKIPLALRKAIFGSGEIQSVSSEDLRFATKDEKFLAALLDKSDPKRVAEFVTSERVGGKSRAAALNYVSDQKVIYQVATTGGDLKLRAAAILRLGDQELVVKAAKVTLAQIDAATFADNLDPKKRESIRSALLQVVGNYYNPSERHPEKRAAHGRGLRGGPFE